MVEDGMCYLRSYLTYDYLERLLAESVAVMTNAVKFTLVVVILLTKGVNLLRWQRQVHLVVR
ncbi:hypothetical protein PF001_g11064 [Phytophthora fragariae]|uniref:Uncharacterized protein n=1 Tax=Phytophthora fragariae TaxID=53985 RepID=A0A6A3E506_9STRA|nr:hypothetical protein PF009_g22299 [Phytophthora fragariae]KAE9308631.1 hypothetical protein PF001_g11064 [Phytophthora fragariae]